MRLIESYSGPPITWEKYLSSIRGRVPRAVHTALLLAMKATETFPLLGAMMHQSRATIYTVGAAILAALSESDAPLAEVDALTGGEGDSDAANRLSGWAAAIENPRLGRLDSRDEAHMRRVRADIYADVSCQRSIQRSFTLDWALSAFMLGWDPVSKQFEEPPELAEAVRHAFSGDHGPSSAAIALCVAHGARDAYVHLGASAAKVSPVLANALRQVLPAIALPAGKVGEVLREDLSQIPGLATRVCAFWFRHPIIHLGAEHYLLAPARFLTAALGIQHLFRVLDAASAIEGRRDTAASRYTGRRLEEFVCIALEAAEERAVVLRQHEFRADKNDLSPDVILADRGDTVLTLIEVKSRGVGPQAFFGLDPEALYADLAERVGKPLVQLIRWLRSLSDAHASGRLTGEGARDWALLQASRELVLAFVCPSIPAGVAGCEFRDAVFSGVRSVLEKDDDLEAFWLKLNRDRVCRWIALDAEDVSFLAGWRSKRRIGRTIVQYLRDQSRRPSLSSTGPAPDILEWIEERGWAEGLELSRPVQMMTTTLWDGVSSAAFGRPVQDGTEPA